jgi:hypothetical protein
LSKELVAFGTDSWEEIAKLTGAYTGSTSSFLPNLKVNTEAVTDNDNTVPVGTYMITQDGNRIYSKTALFRPFLNTFQYITYDPKIGKYTNKSVIIKNFNEDAIDELGGVRCGKITRKELEVLQAKNLISEEDLKKQSNTSCHRKLYGLVTFEEAVTETGEKTSIENLPVIWDTSRSNFNAAKNALDAITKIKHLYFQHWLQLDKPKREKNGSVVYYLVNAEAILDKEVEFTPEDMTTFKEFQMIIDRENKAVAEKWRNKKAKAEPFNLEADVLSELDLNDDISDI